MENLSDKSSNKEQEKLPPALDKSSESVKTEKLKVVRSKTRKKYKKEKKELKTKELPMPAIDESVEEMKSSMSDSDRKKNIEVSAKIK